MLEFSKKIISSFLLVLILLTFTMVADAVVITSGDTAQAIDENSGAGQVIYTASSNDSHDIVQQGAISQEFIDNGDNTFTVQFFVDASIASDFDQGVQGIGFAIGYTSEDSELSFQGAEHTSNPLFAVDNIVNNEILFQAVYAENEVYAPADKTYYDASSDTPILEATFSVSDGSQVNLITVSQVSLMHSVATNASEYTVTAVSSYAIDAENDVTYSLAAGSDSALSINSLTGEVTLANNPIYSFQNVYEFSVLAEDAAGNISSPQSVTLQINETIPPVAHVSLETDTGVSADNISSVVKILVSNIKLGATWEYSLDNGVNWLNGTGSSFTIDNDGSYQVNVRQTNTAGTTAMSESVPFTLDTLPPIVEFVSADSEAGTISVNYNENLDPAFSPNASDYDITQNGNSLTINNLSVIDNVLVLSVTESFNPGALNFTYSASTDANEQVTDLAGNKLDQGFIQMIVSVGYIRGAQVYIDVNGDGIASEDELREKVTSDAFGQIILTDEFLNAPENTDYDGNPYQMIVKGGVNVDSGAPNEIELTAPAGYSVISPLSTLVSEIASSDEYAGMTAEEAAAAAEASLADSLGIEVGEGGLGSYDPQSDNNVANRVVATQIATVLAVASSSESTGSVGAEAAALSSLASTITSASADGGTVTLDSSTIGDVLGDVVDGVALDALNEAVDAMEAVKNSDDLDAAFATIVEAQAKAIDTVAPQAPEPALAPESNSGVSDTDALTKVTSPIVRIVLETSSNDGTAVVAGDQLEIWNTGVSQGVFALTAQHIEDGYFDYDWTGELLDGYKFISATVTDRAGMESYVSTYVFMIDTLPLEIISDNTAPVIDENSGDGQVIYKATVDTDDLWKFELSENSDSALSINAETGEVTLTNPDLSGDSGFPDYEAQSHYTFTVIAYDLAGNTSEQIVTLDINALDEVTPMITSGSTAAVDENSGAGQVIYTATAYDANDIVAFSLKLGSDETLVINSLTGEVRLNEDPDYDSQSEYNFTVVATDAAGNQSEQTVVLVINKVFDPPQFTSPLVIDIAENIGSNQVIYSAQAESDTEGGVVYSLLENDQQQGAIKQTFIDNNDGTYTMQLAIEDSVAEENNNSISCMDFDLEFNPNEVEDINADDLNFVGASIFHLAVNDSYSDQIRLGVLFDVGGNQTLDISNERAFLEISFSLNAGISSAQFDVTRLILCGDHDYAPSSATFGPSSSSPVVINPNTGEVTLLDNPMYEAQSEYTFTVVATDAAGSTSQTVTVNVVRNLLDIDENGVADALTDGLTIMKYAFGIRDDAIYGESIAADSTLLYSQIESKLNLNSHIFDIDGDGHLSPLSDGLLMLRYLFGLRDDALISGVVSEYAERNSYDEIINYLDTLNN